MNKKNIKTNNMNNKTITQIDDKTKHRICPNCVNLKTKAKKKK